MKRSFERGQGRLAERAAVISPANLDAVGGESGFGLDPFGRPIPAPPSSATSSASSGG